MSKAVDRLFWIVVADEAAAIIYSRERKSSGPIAELRRFENEAARLKATELDSDKSGRSFDRFGPGRHAMGGDRSDSRKHEAEMFAREIAGYIEKGLQDESCRGYALIAAPRFLGLLRDALDRNVKEGPWLTIDKDIVSQDVHFLEELLQRHRETSS